MPAVMFVIALGLAFEICNAAAKNMMTHDLACYRQAASNLQQSDSVPRLTSRLRMGPD